MLVTSTLAHLDATLTTLAVLWVAAVLTVLFTE